MIKTLGWMLRLEFALWCCRRINRKMVAANVDMITWEVQRDMAVEALAELAKQREAELKA